MFAALGDESRLLMLINLGSEGPLSIKQLAEAFPVSRQAVTKHLRVLEQARFVVEQPHGRERRFSVRPACIEEAQNALQSISQQWSDALLRLKQFVESEP